MRSEPRKEDLNVNIVLWSGIATRDDEGKQLEDNAWVCKAPVKEADFNLEHARKMFMEVKKISCEASTLGSKDMPC